MMLKQQKGKHREVSSPIGLLLFGRSPQRQSFSVKVTLPRTKAPHSEALSSSFGIGEQLLSGITKMVSG